MKNLFTKIRGALFFSLLLVAVACKKDNVQPVSPVGQPTRTVVILGSSTAFGTGATPIDSGWVGLMKTKLANDNKPARVYNLAKLGYTTYQALPTDYPVPAGRPIPDPDRNITAALAYKPDLVIINLPTNDIADGYKDTEIIANYKVIVAALNEASVQYMITGTQPRDFTTNIAGRLKTTNDLMLNTFPGKIVDYLAKLSTPSWGILPEYAFGDGIHLNSKGHSIVFQSITGYSIFKSIFAY